MSEPTYRIDVTYGDSLVVPEKPWTAYVQRLSDGKVLAAKPGESIDDAITSARSYIAGIAAAPVLPLPVFTSEDGEIVSVPEPQSLRA